VYDAGDPRAAADKSLRRVKKGKKAWIYENTAAYPRTWIAHHAQRVAQPDAILHELMHGSVNPRETALLEEAPPALKDGGRQPLGVRRNGSRTHALRTHGRTPHAPRPTENCEVTEYRPERVLLTAELTQPGLVVLADASAPGWKATVDGRAAHIYRAHYLLRAVAVPSGKHRIVFTYQAHGLSLGRWVSGGALLLLLRIALRGRRSRMVNHADPESAERV
jgi:hypothetical protein